MDPAIRSQGSDGGQKLERRGQRLEDIVERIEKMKEGMKGSRFGAMTQDKYLNPS